MHNTGLHAPLLLVLSRGELPPSLTATFSSTYFLALQKDPDIPLKLRPLGIGTALRRFTGSLLASHFAPRFAHFLQPFQFGIGISGGMEFIIHSIHAQAQQFIPDASPSSTSSRALLSLDLVNMFNSISRDCSRSVLAEHFPSLIPFFDTLYSTSNTCWYLSPSGSWSSFLQHEGFAQGCPLSPAFACLALHTILVALDRSLRRRAHARKSSAPGDDGQGSITSFLAYLDDVNALIPFIDLAFTLEEFRHLGVPIGAVINQRKTKILSSFSSQPPLSSHLSSAAALLSPSSHLQQGIRLLGVPLGSTHFVDQYLDSQADLLAASASRLQSKLRSLQTRFTLFTQCIQAKVPHLMFADVLAHYHPSSSLPMSPYHWSSPFMQRINSITAAFLSALIAPSPPIVVDSFAWSLAHLPLAMGGLGLQDYSARAVASFCIPFTRSLRITHHGLSLDGTLVPLPASLSHSFSTWSSSPLPLFASFRDLALPLLSFESFPPACDRLSFLVHDLPLDSLLRDLIRSHKRRSLDSLHSLAPLAFRPLLPSLLSPLTSAPFRPMSRKDPDLRVPNDTFSLALCRKLRLPCLPLALTHQLCLCGAALDPYGDHFFSCRRFSKAAAHNKIRDGLFLCVSQLGPIAEFIHTHSDVLLEPHHLLAQHPTSRPADVGLFLHPSYPSCTGAPFRFAALDVTITPSLPSTTHLADTYNYAESARRLHLDSERHKFNGRDVRSHGSLVTGQFLIDECNRHDILLLPLSFDPLGGIGPIATSFFYDTFGPGPPPAPTFRHDSARLAHAHATGPHRLSGLFPFADKHWHILHPGAWFTSTYHCMLPSQWARQILGLHLHSAFSQHLRSSFTKCLAPLLASHPRPAHILGQRSRFPGCYSSGRSSLVAGSHTSVSSGSMAASPSSARTRQRLSRSLGRRSAP